MTYNELKLKSEELRDIFDVETIGKSYLKRDILAFSPIYKPYKDNVIITAAIHAREHITCDLIIKIMELIKINYEIIEYIPVNMYFIPMINPDGVELCINGIQSVVQESHKKFLLEINNSSEDFSLWKANAKGVDLNNNFNVDWDKFKKAKTPSSQGYIGLYPESEIETKSLINFTKKISPFLTINYHCKGEEIYYQYFQKETKRDKKIAQLFSKSTGYKIKNVQKTSSGGYKDWCIKNLKIPSLTIEIGNENLSHPLPLSTLPNLLNKNLELPVLIKKSYEIFTYSKKY